MIRFLLLLLLLPRAELFTNITDEVESSTRTILGAQFNMTSPSQAKLRKSPASRGPPNKAAMPHTPTPKDGKIHHRLKDSFITSAKVLTVQGDGKISATKSTHLNATHNQQRSSTQYGTHWQATKRSNTTKSHLLGESSQKRLSIRKAPTPPSKIKSAMRSTMKNPSARYQSPPHLHHRNVTGKPGTRHFQYSNNVTEPSTSTKSHRAVTPPLRHALKFGQQNTPTAADKVKHFQLDTQAMTQLNRQLKENANATSVLFNTVINNNSNSFANNPLRTAQSYPIFTSTHGRRTILYERNSLNTQDHVLSSENMTLVPQMDKLINISRTGIFRGLNLTGAQKSGIIQEFKSDVNVGIPDGKVIHNHTKPNWRETVSSTELSGLTQDESVPFRPEITTQVGLSEPTWTDTMVTQTERTSDKQTHLDVHSHGRVEAFTQVHSQVRTTVQAGVKMQSDTEQEGQAGSDLVAHRQIQPNWPHFHRHRHPELSLQNQTENNTLSQHKQTSPIRPGGSELGKHHLKYLHNYTRPHSPEYSEHLLEQQIQTTPFSPAQIHPEIQEQPESTTQIQPSHQNQPRFQTEPTPNIQKHVTIQKDISLNTDLLNVLSHLSIVQEKHTEPEVTTQSLSKPLTTTQTQLSSHSLLNLTSQSQVDLAIQTQQAVTSYNESLITYNQPELHKLNSLEKESQSESNTKLLTQKHPITLTKYHTKQTIAYNIATNTQLELTTQFQPELTTQTKQHHTQLEVTTYIQPQVIKYTRAKITTLTHPELTTHTELDLTLNSQAEVTTHSQPKITSQTPPELMVSTQPGLQRQSQPEQHTQSQPAQPRRSQPAQPRQSQPAQQTQSQPEQHTQSHPEQHTQSQPEQHTPSQPEQQTQSQPEQHTQSQPAQPRRSQPAQPRQSQPEQHTQSQPEQHTQSQPAQPRRSQPAQPRQSQPAQQTQSQPEQHTQSHPEQHTQSQPEQQTQSQPEQHTPSQPEQQTQSQPEQHTQSQPAQPRQSQPQQHTQSQPEQQTQSQPEQHTPSQPEQQTQSQPEQHTQSQPAQPRQSQPEQQTQSQPEQHTQSHPEQHTQSQPEQQTQSQPEQHTQSQPEQQTQSQPEQHTQSQPAQPRQSQPQQHTQSQPEQQTQSQPEQHTQSQPAQPRQSQPEEQTQSQPEQHTQNQPEQHTQSQPEQHTQSQPAQPRQSQPEQQTLCQPEQHTQSQQAQPRQSQPEQQTQSQPEQHTQSQPEQHTQSQPAQPRQSQPEQHTQSQPEQHTQSQPEQHTQSQPEQHTQSQPEQHTQSQPEQHTQSQQEQHTQSQPELTKHTQQQLSRNIWPVLSTQALPDLVRNNLLGEVTQTLPHVITGAQPLLTTQSSPNLVTLIHINETQPEPITDSQSKLNEPRPTTQSKTDFPTQTEPITKTKTRPPTQTGPITERETGSPTQTEPITERETGSPTQTEPITERETGSPTQTEPITETTTESLTQTESIPENNTGLPTQTQPIINTKIGLPTQTQPITNTKIGSPTQTDQVSNSKSEVATQTEPVTKSKAETRTQTERIRNSKSEPTTQHKAESTTHSEPITSKETKYTTYTKLIIANKTESLTQASIVSHRRNTTEPTFGSMTEATIQTQPNTLLELTTPHHIQSPTHREQIKSTQTQPDLSTQAYHQQTTRARPELITKDDPGMQTSKKQATSIPEIPSISDRHFTSDMTSGNRTEASSPSQTSGPQSPSQNGIWDSGVTLGWDMGAFYPTSRHTSDSPNGLTTKAKSYEPEDSGSTKSLPSPQSNTFTPQTLGEVMSAQPGRDRIFIVDEQQPVFKVQTINVTHRMNADHRAACEQPDPCRALYLQELTSAYKSAPEFDKIEILNVTLAGTVVEYKVLFTVRTGTVMSAAQELVLTNPNLLFGSSATSEKTFISSIHNASLADHADPCADWFSCPLEFQCVPQRELSALCLSPCHSTFCHNNGICIHRKGQQPECQCPIGRDFWYMGQTCDYRMSHHRLAAIACAVVFCIIICAAAAVFFLVRRFQTQILQQKVAQTQSSYRRFSRFDDVPTQFWCPSQTWLTASASLNSLDNPAFSSSEEVFPLQALGSCVCGCQDGARTSAPIIPPQPPAGAPRLETSCSSVNDLMIDSGKASDVSVCSWPMEPIHWTPFPILHQLSLQSPFHARRPHSYFEGMELVNTERSWTA